MLYENEVVKSYDPVSGDIIAELVERGSPDQEVEALITRSRKFKELKSSDGWLELEIFLRSMIAEYTDMLVWERDADRLYRIQEAIKSYSNIFKHIDQTINEADTYEQERTLHQEANPRSDR